MVRRVPLTTRDMIFEDGVRADLEIVLASKPRTVVIVWEDEKEAHCLARPHTRGVINGVLRRLLVKLKLLSDD